MSKRIKLETLKRFAIASGIVGTPLAIVFIMFLMSSGVITVGNYTATEVCGGNMPCELILNDVCFNDDVFLYPMNGSELINARPSDSINSLKLYRSWGKGWRNIPLDRGCAGSYCGCYWCKFGIEAKYSYAFRKDKCYDLKYEIYKDAESTINWNIGDIK